MIYIIVLMTNYISQMMYVTSTFFANGIGTIELIFGTTVLLIFVKVFKILSNTLNSYFINSAYKKQAENLISKRNETIVVFITEYKDKVSIEDQKLIQQSHLLQLKEYFLSGKYSSVQITISLLFGAVHVGKENNYIADINFEDTLRLAREADLFFSINKNNQELLQKFPILGLPLSFKESLPAAKFRSTLGYCVNVTRPPNDDCYLINVLRRKGAIPLITTNVPQGLISCESDNNIYGKSLNPFDKD